MYQPIRTALEGKFKSLDALAKALCAQAPELEWPTYRSLSTKIGQLDRGDATWWQRRFTNAEALAKLLGVDAEDFGLHAKTSDNLFHFIDFPELPPVDLRREAFCQLADPLCSVETRHEDLDSWFGVAPRWVRREPSGTSWLYVQRGTGRSLLLAELAAAKRFEVIEVTSLAEAAPRIKKPEPVVIAVSVDGGIEDLVALSQRPYDSGTLIIAPFPAPFRHGADPLEVYSWESITADILDRRILGLTNPQGLRESIHPYTWQLKKDWQDRLLAWVESRLAQPGRDTLFTAKGLRTWLDAFDPQQEWIRTPADLMALCRASHGIPETKLPRYTDPTAGKQLLKVILGPKPYQAVLFTRLATARWNSIGHSWRTPLSFETWQALNPAATTVVGQADLLAIANAPNQKARRAQADRVAELMTGAGIQSLMADDLLVNDAQGRLELRPRSLADLVVRDQLMAQMASQPLRSWTMACFDPERRPTVDAALDALRLGDLTSVMERLHQEPIWTSTELGASEALFYAIARRILAGEKMPDALLDLAPRILSRIYLDDVWSLPEPWSRSLTAERERHEWLATCWAWSLTPKPGTPELADYAGWLFMGWSAALPETPFWLPQLSLEEHRDTYPSSWDRLLQAADRVVSQRDAPLPSAPPFLHGSLLGASAGGAWPAEPDWWEGVLGYEWAEDRLLKMLERHGSAAVRLWPSFIRYEASRTEHSDRITARFSRMRSWILKRLTADEALSALGSEELDYLIQELFSLPPPVRSALFARLPLEALESNFKRAQIFFKLCSPDAVADLARWLETSVGFIAAEKMWEQNSRETLKWIRTNAELKKDSAKMLILNIPQEHAAMGAEALIENRSLLSLEERRGWVKSRLHAAGASADKILAVLQLP